MSRTKELEINTVVVSGNPSSFRAALSRSILGVTFKKFHGKKKEFFAHRVHNEVVTEGAFNNLYESLLLRLRNISDLELKTRLRPMWDDSGKILAFSDITVSVYLKVGELKIDKLEVAEGVKNIKIDLFFSEIDARSKKLKSDLPKLVQSFDDKIEYREYDFLGDGREMAKMYNVVTVPTVMINAEKLLVDPNENELRGEIDKAFTAKVEPVSAPLFIPDKMLEPNVKVVAHVNS